MKISAYDFTELGDSAEQFRFEISSDWNNGKYPFPIVRASTPTWKAQPGESVIFSPSSGGMTLFVYSIASSWTAITSSMGVPQVIAFPLSISSGGTGTTAPYGLYQPGSTSVANLDAISLSSAQYMILGSSVTVSGRFTADPTAPAAATIFGMALPFPSAMTASDNLSGVAFCGNIAGQGAEITADQTNDRAQVRWVSGDVTSQNWSYIYMYQVK